jgi:hypothetical protein
LSSNFARPGWYENHVELQHTDEESIVRTAAERLEAEYPAVDHALVRQRVRDLVHDLCAHARVTNFVGIIAERRARDELKRARASQRRGS